MNPTHKVPEDVNAQFMTISRHDRPNERIHIRRLDFSLFLLLIEPPIQSGNKIFKQKEKHQVPRDHGRMDIHSGEMELDLFLLLRGPGELLVCPMRTNEGREYVAT